MCHFWDQNGPFVIFLVQTIIITFIYLLALFIVQNLKKFLQQIQSYNVPFLGPKWSICIKQKFFQKIIIIFIYLLTPFIVQHLKKILTADPELWGFVIFGAQNGPFPQMIIFFRKPANEPCFFSFMCIYMPKIKVRY